MIDDIFAQSGFAQSDPAPLEPSKGDRRSVTLHADELERALTRAVRLGISEAIRQATSDENVQKFWKRGFNEFTANSSDHVRRGLGGWLIKWGSGILATAGLVLWLRFGPWK